MDTACPLAKSTRMKAFVSSYIVLRKDNMVLLSLRQNTGYADGEYGLVAGHVEEEESASAAIIREAYEEAAIFIKPESLKPVHIMHRKTERYNVDIFFECHEWEGTPINHEPNKCGGVTFFSLDQLPENTQKHIRWALEDIENGKFYSEHGW